MRTERLIIIGCFLFVQGLRHVNAFTESVPWNRYIINANRFQECRFASRRSCHDPRGVRVHALCIYFGMYKRENLTQDDCKLEQNNVS